MQTITLLGVEGVPVPKLEWCYIGTLNDLCVVWPDNPVSSRHELFDAMVTAQKILLISRFRCHFLDEAERLKKDDGSPAGALAVLMVSERAKEMEDAAEKWAEVQRRCR